MNPQQYKKVARLLKEAYAQLQQEALDDGMSIGSAEFQSAVDNVRQLILARNGFTLQEYRDIKAKIEAFTSADIMQEVEMIRQSIADLYIPTPEDITTIAQGEIQKNLKAPEIINKIVKEVTIQKPQIVKETTIEKTVQEIAYNERPILDSIIEVNKRIDDLPKAQNINLEDIKAELKLDFGKMLQHNIDILGMPDFRKLAMGLQGQIDAIISAGAGHTIQDEGSALTTRKYLNFVGAGVTATDDVLNNATKITISTSAGAGYQQPSSGSVDGSNTIFIFAVAPNAIVVDGVSLQKTATDTTANWTGTTTITLAVAPNFDIYGVA